MSSSNIVPFPRPKRQKKSVLTVRIERDLLLRLRRAADMADITPSDKLRRILDASLPPAA